MFSARIKRRKQLWWRDPGAGQTFVDHMRRLEMLHVKLDSHAPEGRWRRGEYWQRRLLNKLNSKQFAIRLNCPVPKLYWHGRFLTRSVLSCLPGYFVLKPALGGGSRGIYVMAESQELLSGRTVTRGQLFDEIIDNRGLFSPIPMLAEELISGKKGEYTLPVEYKFHVFGDTIGAIQVVQRSNSPDTPTCHRFYSQQWEPYTDPIMTNNAFGGLSDPPKCLAQMIDAALAIGKSFDTYVRVDLYATDKGCVFGELSSTPRGAQYCTPYADALFGALWQQHIPDCI